MQMAVAYSAIVNGGTVWEPKIAEAVRSPSGAAGADAAAPRRRHVPIDPYYRQLVMDGLHAAAQTPERHLVRHLRQLPAHRLRQDRHRRPQQPGRPVLVRLLRARRVALDRDRGHGRAGRLRRRGGGARGAADARPVVRPAAPVEPRLEPRSLMADARDPGPAGRARPRCARAARAARLARPDARARGARPRRAVAGRADAGDQARADAAPGASPRHRRRR